jgi:tRNA(adenine34) deaminase
VRTPESDATKAPSGGEAISDEAAMRLALAEAAAATSHGDVPVGAVALVGGTVVASHHNERELRGDPTAHAELLAVRAAASALDRWRLDEVTIVVTLEPCAMCAGALIAARVGRLVFGAADPKAGACGSLYNLCCDPRLNYELPVTAGVLAGEAGGLLQDFFARRRRREATAGGGGAGPRVRAGQGRGGAPGGGGTTGAGAAPPGSHVARSR